MRLSSVGESFQAKGGRMVAAATPAHLVVAAAAESSRLEQAKGGENRNEYLHLLKPTSSKPPAAAAAASPRPPSLPAAPPSPDDSLNLYTSIKVFTNFRPSPQSPTSIRATSSSLTATPKCYSVDEESAHRISTFELLSSDSAQVALALTELLYQVEDEQCDRFYVLDEALGSCAVVCGPQTAFWYGTTPSIRDKLQRHLLPPCYKLTSSNKDVERLHEHHLQQEKQQQQLTGRLAQECTLYFSSTMQVRGMIESIVNSKAKLRILASSPFPNCQVKVCVASMSVRSTVQPAAAAPDQQQPQQSQHFVTTMEGAYFNSLEMGRFIQAFYRDNGAVGVRVKLQALALTNDFDRACSELYQEEEEEEEEEDDL